MKLCNTNFARIVVFLKFVIWDKFLSTRKIRSKECWVIAGINTTMPKIPPR